MGLSGNGNKCSGAYADAAGRYSRRVSGRKRSHDACFRAADGNAASESSPAEAISSQPGLHPSGGGLSLRYADGGRPAELAVVLGAAAVFLLLGLSAVGPLPIFLFAMLYGTGSGLLSAQLLNSLGAKQLVLFLLTASLPTALAAGALCLFGASALQVSSRIHAFSFGRGDKGSHPAGARLLVGQFALLAVCLCPLCGAATGLVCLANRLMQAR